MPLASDKLIVISNTSSQLDDQYSIRWDTVDETKSGLTYYISICPCPFSSQNSFFKYSKQKMNDQFHSPKVIKITTRVKIQTFYELKNCRGGKTRAVYRRLPLEMKHEQISIKYVNLGFFVTHIPTLVFTMVQWFP